MEEYLNKRKIDGDKHFISYLCDNCPYRLEEVLAAYQTLNETYSKILSVRNRTELLSVFHLIKEKDSEEFYSSNTEHYLMALQMLQYLFYNLLLFQIHATASESYIGLAALYGIADTHKICIAISDHQRQWLSGAYTKNDFFDLVRPMIHP